MSFLQPILLAGLPLVTLPIIIHLINRQRHRTIPWAAMMFLLDAKRLTRGMARLRYLLILIMRMLAIAGLIFAISRPLTTGWVGLAFGGRPDTTIVVLDRSASMEQQDLQTGQSKRSTGLSKLSQLMRTLGSRTRTVLIENTANVAQEIDSAESLSELSDTAATATSADVPAMLQTALDYVVANETGRTDIWVCSDLRAGDWNAEDGRWAAIREGFERLEGVRFYLLSYPERASDNVAVRVRHARRRTIGQTAELVLDVGLHRESDSTDPLTVPLEFVINGARSVLNVSMTESEHVLQGHTIPLDKTITSGWGRVELPGDSNAQDNVFYFVFAEAPEHRTVIVSQDPRIAEPLRLAAASPADPALLYSATVITPDRIHEIDWDATSLILWHAPLPDGIVAQQMKNFVGNGRPVIFFPPQQAGTNRLFDVQWADWEQAAAGQSVRVASWRGDSGLLSHTQSGTPLPVGELRVYRYCSIAGNGNVLARLDGGKPLLIRSATDGSPAHFCATLPHAHHSSLAQDGVVFYVMIQRALLAGAATQGDARQLEAGSLASRAIAGWEPLSEPAEPVLSSARPFHAAAFQQSDKLAALNRPAREDRSQTIDAAAVDRLFSGLTYRQVEDRVGSTSALASEIWRIFLILMAAALLAEAWLCLPEKTTRQTEVTPA